MHSEDDGAACGVQEVRRRKKMNENFTEVMEAIEFGLSMQGYTIIDHEGDSLIVRKAGDWNQVRLSLSENAG